MYYFDYNASHPPLKEFLEKNLNLYLENYANPSGISGAGQLNQSRIEQARRQLLNDLFEEEQIRKSWKLHFVSTGTEALYQMIRSSGNAGRVLTSPYEHAALYAALEDHNLTVDKLTANPSGQIQTHEMEHFLQKETYDFVCITAVSSETGCIQDIEAISRLCHQYGIVLFSDTVQAAGKLNLDYNLLDGFVLNGHKLGAGPGCACLVLRKQALPLFRGGLQENERRAGTENLPAILNLADAFHFQKIHLSSKNEKLRQMQALFESTMIQAGCRVAGDNRLNNTTLLILPPCDVDFILMGLDQKGMVVSTGASCKSRTRQPSEQLISMGFTPEESLRALRISTGIFTTKEEMDELQNSLIELLTLFRHSNLQ
jgi:cysteine desulfurase